MPPGLLRGLSEIAALAAVWVHPAWGSVLLGNPYAPSTQLKPALPRASWAVEAVLPVFPGLWEPLTIQRDKVGQSLLPEWRRQGTRVEDFLPAFEEGDIEDGSVGVHELEQEGLEG